MNNIPRYYPIQRNWSKFRPIYESKPIIRLMYVEMERYRRSCAEDYKFIYIPKLFDFKLRPSDYDGADWRSRSRKPNSGYGTRRGPQPAFWAWVCHGACHWVVNINLVVISKLEPNRPWQIATNDKHSNVVDLERKLMFDPNYLAMKVCPLKIWDQQIHSVDSKLLQPGKRKKPEYFKD